MPVTGKWSKNGLPNPVQQQLPAGGPAPALPSEGQSWEKEVEGGRRGSRSAPSGGPLLKAGSARAGGPHACPDGPAGGPWGGWAAAWQDDDATMRWCSNAMMQQCATALYKRLLEDRLWWPQLGASGARGASAGSQLQESSWKEPWSTVSLLASETWTHC